MAAVCEHYHLAPDTYWDMDADDADALVAKMNKTIEQMNKGAPRG
jgi:hypothetical protein